MRWLWKDWPKPVTAPGGEVTALAFGGVGFDTLYIRCADGKVYQRKFKVPSLPPGSAPIQLPALSPG
jgi:hypothetical protein